MCLLQVKYFFKKTTCLERQINSQLQLRSSVYNLVAGHPEPGIITWIITQNRKKDEENEIWARSCKVYLSIWACSHNSVCKLLVQVQEQRPWTDLKSTGKTTMKEIFFS